MGVQRVSFCVSQCEGMPEAAGPDQLGPVAPAFTWICSLQQEARIRALSPGCPH